MKNELKWSNEVDNSLKTILAAAKACETKMDESKDLIQVVQKLRNGIRDISLGNLREISGKIRWKSALNAKKEVSQACTDVAVAMKDVIQFAVAKSIDDTSLR